MSAGSCTHCRDNEVRCTFDLPLARRGPKSKKRPESSSTPAIGGIATFLSPPHPAPPPPVSLRVAASDPTHAAAVAGPAFGSPSSSSTGPWEPVGTLGTRNHVLSPSAVRDYPPRTPAGTHAVGALSRWHSLSRALALRNTTVERTVNRCLDLFFKYLYPLTPLVDEPSLRDGLSFFLNQTAAAPGAAQSQSSDLDAAPPNITNVGESWSAFPRDARASLTGEHLKTWPDATFTFITAVCAEAAFLLPKELFPEGESVADLFLQASRDCLNHYLEADLESPSANSITIRYFHSNCIHAAGKPKYSWHIFGEATRLAQVMRLHDESSFEGLYPIEAELRRRAFWIVYMGDKSAAILNNRPITIHKYSFESGITARYPTGLESRASRGPANVSSGSQDTARQSLIHGFNANLRLWQAASDLLLEVRLLQDQRSARHAVSDTASTTGMPESILTEDERQRLDRLYVGFITCLDDLPPYLQSYTFASIAGGGGGGSRGGAQSAHASQFVIQCANLQVSFHCLRMVITQKFEDISYFPPGAEQADLRKTEIVRDMLRVMHEAPFWSLQVNGEPYVEKIRLIGASLLAIIHRNQTSPLGARARSDFSVLLDILTRLDSKASDALRSDSTFAL
ncbi:hypothetical protein JDV02_008705 [Purpureocillium takamizusanense]|nr:uncharacterized protein JDV02_008705 [Purpureocillium takamizusanense]UNI22856.1 hypothetical protein JDV02_008705 [Purpureocillium takamizusanense]